MTMEQAVSCLMCGWGEDYEPINVVHPPENGTATFIELIQALRLTLEAPKPRQLRIRKAYVKRSVKPVIEPVVRSKAYLKEEAQWKEMQRNYQIWKSGLVKHT